MLLSIFVLSVLPQLTFGHGMLVGVGPISKAKPAIRNYDSISYNIDSIRSPNEKGVCRGARKSNSKTHISLQNDVDFTLTLAFSIGAQHIGPCLVEILDADNIGAPGTTIVSLQGPNGCARPPVAGFDTDKQSPASAQCKSGVPSKLVTDDMCLHEWKFKPSNVERIKCKNCVLRWYWEGHHISADNPERYENCIDVTVNISGLPKRREKAETISNLQTRTSSEKLKANHRPPKTPLIRPVYNRSPSSEALSSVKYRTIAPQSKHYSKSRHSDAKCRKGPNAPYYKCISPSEYLACFPESPERPTTVMTCPVGTSCQTNGKFISCL